jgi:hypothetical protein
MRHLCQYMRCSVPMARANSAWFFYRYLTPMGSVRNEMKLSITWLLGRKIDTRWTKRPETCQPNPTNQLLTNFQGIPPLIERGSGFPLQVLASPMLCPCGCGLFTTIPNAKRGFKKKSIKQANRVNRVNTISNIYGLYYWQSIFYEKHGLTQKGHFLFFLGIIRQRTDDIHSCA